MQNSSQKTSKNAKISFFITMLLIPVLFFVLMELLLRLVNIGTQEKIVLRIKEDGKEYYQLNPDVGKRYFVHADENMIPQLFPQKFPVNSLLKDRLSEYFPSRNFEVINFGLSAVNSFTVLDFAREIVHYQPDLVIIYMGHNEFYGAFGVGSVEQLGKSPEWVRLYLRLRQFRTFQLVRNLIAKFLVKSDKQAAANRTLMEQIAKKKSIPLHSADFDLACRYFRKNLQQIVATIQKNHIKVILSTITSNLKDQPPFISLFSDSLSREKIDEWETNFARAKKLLAQKRYDQVSSYLHRCEQIDPHPARLRFLFGKLYLIQKDTLSARAHFFGARDEDALRFRAPSAFNQIITQIAANNKIPLVPIDSIFNASSYDGIVGYELISEHLHPNIRGYELMAKSFSQAFLNHLSLNEKPENLSLSNEYFHTKAAITLLDEAIGDFAIQHLTSRWPFKRKRALLHYQDSAEKNYIESLIKEYKTGVLSWNKAHFELANYYLRKNQPEKAIAEYLAVIKVVPNDYYGYFKLGNLFFSRNKFNKAVLWYQKALARNDMPFIKAKLGMVYLNMSLFSKAAAIFQDAVRQEEMINSLSNQEKSLLFYYFAISQIKLDKIRAAKLYLKKSLQFNNNNGEAHQLLQLLNANKKVKIQF
ncbi:hypothetical protein B6D60_09815 [candidate division KSB1 bacterium 4484_87]|nr:MAG: hypothetical protein B6D60_09815 [candidate division KSB1 bacterium 4484_87]